MTPAPAAASSPAPSAAAALDNNGTLEMPGAALSDALTGGNAAPFAAALAIFQDPLLVGTSTDKPAGKPQDAAQIQLPAAPADASAAALAAILQWLRQTTGDQPQAAHDQPAARVAAGEDSSIGAISSGNAAAAPALSALLAAHYKGDTKASDGTATNSAVGQGAAASGCDALANAAATGAAGKPATVLPGQDSKPLPQELLALANALGQPGAEQDSASPQGGRASDAKASALTATDTLAVATSAAAGNNPAATVIGPDRGASARAAAAATPAPTERTVSVPVHDRHWSQAIAAQVLVLADHRIESATLRLTPEHLGPVDVHIDLQDTQVNVNFGAAHSDTRSALEQALPRLREVLAGAGLTLGEASVQQQLRRGSQNRPDGARANGESADAQPVALSASLRTIGMIDEYA